jgi:hypothetical protein
MMAPLVVITVFYWRRALSAAATAVADASIYICILQLMIYTPIIMLFVIEESYVASLKLGSGSRKVFTQIQFLKGNGTSNPLYHGMPKFPKWARVLLQLPGRHQQFL